MSPLNEKFLPLQVVTLKIHLVFGTIIFRKFIGMYGGP